MLSEARNRELTQTGPDTRMGRLLRRYWWPVAITSDLADFPRRAVRLLGEDLVVFRDGSGRYGLLDRVCPHRGASLAYGICEADGLRCGYHGWLFDADGRCLEQPGEPPGSTFHEQITVRAHRVEELGGLVWGYLGPEPAPKLPRYAATSDNSLLAHRPGVELP